jgi:hypothetical protein
VQFAGQLVDCSSGDSWSGLWSHRALLSVRLWRGCADLDHWRSSRTGNPPVSDEFEFPTLFSEPIHELSGTWERDRR